MLDRWEDVEDALGMIGIDRNGFITRTYEDFPSFRFSIENETFFHISLDEDTNELWTWHYDEKDLTVDEIVRLMLEYNQQQPTLDIFRPESSGNNNPLGRIEYHDWYLTIHRDDCTWNISPKFAWGYIHYGPSAVVSINEPFCIDWHGKETPYCFEEIIKSLLS